ncbi:MAG: helix-turn-helix domain-containing protein [Ignavibacteria bacterium]|nr:helix-turn-helix domain-containing protein [Ignavibacteria bacterium]
MNVSTLMKTSRMILLREIILFFPLFFLITSASFCQSQYENLLKKFQAAPVSEQKEIFEKIILGLFDSDTTISRGETERLLKVTKKMNDQYYYIRTFLFYAGFARSISQRNNYITGYKLASDFGDKMLMADAMSGLSNYYYQNMQYDSAAICILQARELYKENNTSEREAAVIHQIGNLFFSAELYDRAEIYFKEVMRIKGHPFQWFNWRKFVMTNNLGLIEKARKNYDKAIFYFDDALQELIASNKDAFNVSDTIRMVYSYVSLASLYILKRDYKNAEACLNRGFTLESRRLRPQNMTPLFFTKGEFHYYQSEFDSSLYYFKKAEETNELFGSIELAEKISGHTALAYSKKDDYRNAWKAEVIHKQIQDSLQSKKKLYAGLQFISDDLLNKNKNMLSEIEARQKFMLAAILLLAISALTIFIFYIRLKKVQRSLDGKNIELKEVQKEAENSAQPAEADENNKPEQSPELSNSAVSESELLKIKWFIAFLEEEMNLRHYYTEKDITLDILADRLNVNRSFLSKAINQTYNLHFNAYINNLRIKRAILMLSNPEEKKKYTLEGIAAKVGFHNRGTFNLAFKQYTGTTATASVRELQAKTTV